MVFAAAIASARPKPPNPIDLETRDGLYVKEIVVDWQVDDVKKAAEPGYADNKAEMIRQLTDSVRDQFQYSPAGADAVALHIAVRSFRRYEVVGDVSVVRLADQRALGTYEKIDGYYIGQVYGGGLLGAVVGLSSVPDPEPGAANCFAAILRARFNDLDAPHCNQL